MREYLLVLLVAAAVTYLGSAFCRRLAFRVGALARVRDRDVHTIEMPYFGGIAMLGGVGAALLLSWQLPFLGSQATVQQDSRAVLVAAAVIGVVGVLDDVYELPALAKFAGQVLAAGVAVGARRQDALDPGPGQPRAARPASTRSPSRCSSSCCAPTRSTSSTASTGWRPAWSAIGAFAFFAYSYLLTVDQDLTRATTSSLISVAIVGVCLGFLPHNFFPARMFMGDSGSMLLGLLLATSTVSLTGQIDPSQLDSDRGLVPVDPAAGPAAGHPGAAVPRPRPGLRPAHVRRASGGSCPTSSTCTTGSCSAGTASAARCC